MFIFLDESYNLKDRTKPQFISISGFKTMAAKRIWKRWKSYRRGFVSKARIHATDKRFELLREKAFDLIYTSSDTALLTVFQNIKEIPVGKISPYYKKDKLNFEKVYEDIFKAILDELHLQEYKQVVITLDSRKHKGGVLGEKKFQDNVMAYLKQYYPNTTFRFDIIPSTANILIEIADFVSNTFYKQYGGQKIEYLEKLEVKTMAIKNPLGKPRR